MKENNLANKSQSNHFISIWRKINFIKQFVTWTATTSFFKKISKFSHRLIKHIKYIYIYSFIIYFNFCYFFLTTATTTTKTIFTFKASNNAATIIITFFFFFNIRPSNFIMTLSQMVISSIKISVIISVNIRYITRVASFEI